MKHVCLLSVLLPKIQNVVILHVNNAVSIYFIMRNKVHTYFVIYSWKKLHILIDDVVYISVEIMWYILFHKNWSIYFPQKGNIYTTSFSWRIYSIKNVSSTPLKKNAVYTLTKNTVCAHTLFKKNLVCTPSLKIQYILRQRNQYILSRGNNHILLIQMQFILFKKVSIYIFLKCGCKILTPWSFYCFGYT